MAKHEFVAGTQVWSTLERLSGRCTEPKFVASAYLGDGAGDLVQLDKGDVLVVHSARPTRRMAASLPVKSVG